MTTMTIPARAAQAIETGPWTSQDWYATGVLLAQSCGIVGAGALLYALGPALGVTLLIGGLTVGALLRKRAALAKDGPADASGCKRADVAGAPVAPGRSARLRNPAMSSGSSTRPALRHGGNVSPNTSQHRIRLVRYLTARRTPRWHQS